MRILLLIIFFFFSLPLKSESLDITDSTTLINLDESTYFFKNSNDSIGINDLEKVNWQKSDKGGNLGLTKDVYWLKYEFNNVSNQTKELFLFFPYNYVNYIDVYQVINDEIILLNELGTVRNILNNDRVSRGWVTKVSFPSNKSTIIVKAKHLYAPLRINAFILEEKLLDKTIVASYSFLWLWKGIFIFALIISLVMYYFLNSKIFIYYFLFHIGLFFSLGVDFGDLNFLFKENPNNWAIDIQRLANLLGLFFFPLFLNEFTPIKKYNPNIWSLMTVGYCLFVLIWITNLFIPVKNSIIYLYSNYYFIGFSILIMLLQLFFLFRSFIDKVENSKMLLIIYTTFIGSLIIYGFTYMVGISKDTIFVYNPILLSSIFPVITFLFLIGFESSKILIERNLLVKKQSIHEVELIKAVVDSQESERNFVGRELHDMVGANLAVIKQKTDKSNKHKVKLIDDTIDIIRSLSHGLITPNIQYSNMEEEMQDLLSMFETDTMKVKYYFHKWPELKNITSANHIYRIIQELLQNALKHSEASEVYLQFLNHDAHLSVMYEDNGKGFDVNNKSNFGRGLFNIENRVSLINGTIHIDSTSTGTSINIEFENL